MKKLLFITILSTILVCIINIFSFYLFNYPDDTEIWEIIKYYTEWKELIVVYFLIFSFSILLSLFLFKKQKFTKKFYFFIICFNIILFVFISVKGVNSLIENKKYLEQTITEFRKDAEKDIKIDNVKCFSQGLMLPPKSDIDAKIQSDIEIIQKKYGLNHKNLGCTISPILTKAQEEYKKITDVYLEKRNGKNWKIKMRKQIDSINKNSR
jgi:hypothetical protein